MLKHREALGRMILLLLAAGLPLVLSFTWTASALAPKQALWLLGTGLLIVLPEPLALAGSGIPGALLALAAVITMVSRPVSPDLLPYLFGVVLWLRARELADDRAFVRKYLLLTVATATLVALNAISQAVWNRIFTDVRLMNPFGTRVLSTLGNPTFLADYLAIQLPLALVLAARARNIPGFATWTAAAAVMAAAIALSGSKGGQLAAGVAFLAWLYLTVRDRTMPRPRLAALIGLLVGATVALAMVSGTPRLAINRWTSETDRFSFGQRAEILRGAGRLLAESPVFGHGAGAFPVEIPRYQSLALNRSIGITLSVNHAHNDFVETAVDLGMAGLGLLLLLLVSGLRRTGGLKAGLGLSLVAMTISLGTNFFIHLPASAFFLWFHLGLLASGGRVVARPRRAMALFGWILAAFFALAAGRHLLSTGWFTQGQAAVDRGDHAAALLVLEKALGTAPNDRHVWQYLGRAYELKSDWPRAEAVYLRARALGPWHAITALNVGRILRAEYLADGSPVVRYKAVESFMRVVNANPYQVEARVWGAELASAAGRADVTADLLSRYPADLPVTPGWHRARAKWLASRGDRSGAHQEEISAVKMETAGALASAESAYAQGQTAEAIESIKKLLKVDPRNAIAWENLGFYLHNTGRISEAKSCYEKVVALNPKSIPVRLNLAYIAMQGKNLGVADRHIRAALAAAPDSLDAHLARARFLAVSRNPSGAAKEYRWILEKDPGQTVARAELARIRP
jgi:tetratricopeptide (TPR) repeat protein